MMRDSDGHDVITMGCIDDFQRSQLNCHVGSQTYVAIKCCNNANFCNQHLIPRYVTDNSASAHHYHFDDGVAGTGKHHHLVRLLGNIFCCVQWLLFISLISSPFRSKAPCRQPAGDAFSTLCLTGCLQGIWGISRVELSGRCKQTWPMFTTLFGEF